MLSQPSDAVRDDLIHLQTLSTIGSHMAPWSAATPAQDVLAMLDNFISGNQVDVEDAVKLREMILGVGKDWYQPPPALKQRLSIVSSRSEQRAADKTLRSLLVSAVDPTAVLHFQEAMAIQEEVDETGATYEGQGQEVPNSTNSESVHPLQTRSKALPVEEASPALLEVEDTTFLHVKEPSEEVLVLLSTIDEWQFDSFALDEVSQGWPLSMLTFAILSRHGLVSPRHHVKGVQLATYLRKLEEGYGDNPYHCRAHAADVVRTLYCLLTRGSVLKTAWLPQDMDMAMIVAMLAAALHDYQHKGFNNDFLIKSSDELAVLYNDSSPMENHHLAAAFALMKEDSCNFLQHMPVRQKSEMRKMVIEAVMATDMKQHFSLTSLFNTKFSSTAETAVGHATVVRRSLMSSRDLSAGLDGELRSLVLQIAMKCADLGALAAARKVHVQWVQRLEEETRGSRAPLKPAKESAHGSLQKRTKQGSATVLQRGCIALIQVICGNIPRLQSSAGKHKW
ncbi:hypothetical protein CEUSTIGMA_g10959.t1 [Chlamydomonas eustigma]|uniref:Phosphodiesterase n=1 Tax=Chlamydomonas eustigma TaxID=1157962 RepID=A0A250XKD8_9CHLO|nr:hypothetical protein CEUSTIGMA_g10959.t1 [Chlamydomonas eustigma]|eukprot:GAX83534.1 hypothetical protein CEUSTIGMA_g10959.t1 [Chlamydomonas eustigma]